MLRSKHVVCCRCRVVGALAVQLGIRSCPQVSMVMLAAAAAASKSFPDVVTLYGWQAVRSKN